MKLHYLFFLIIIVNLFCNTCEECIEKPILDNPRFLTKPFPIDIDTSKYQSEAKVVSFSDASFFIVWNEHFQKTYRVVGQRFLPNGIRFGKKLYISPELSENFSIEIAVFSNDHFIVGYSNGNRRKFQIFDKLNNTIGQEIETLYFDVIIRDENSFYLYFDPTHNNSAQLYNATGVSIGNAITFPDNNLPFFSLSGIVRQKNNTYAKVYYYLDSNSDSYNVYGYVMDSTFTSIIDAIRINTVTNRDQTTPVISAIDGHLFCVWNGYFNLLYGRTLDTLMQFTGPEIIIDDGSIERYSPQVVSLDNGLVVVANLSNFQVRCTEIDPLRDTTLTTYQLDRGNINEYDFSLAPLNNGRYVVVWSPSYQNKGGKMYARIIQSEY